MSVQHAFAQPEADVVEARPRARRVRRDAAGEARIGDELPALDRLPVVRDGHGAAGAERVDHRDEVVGQLREVVVGRALRHAGQARAAHVVRSRSACARAAARRCRRCCRRDSRARARPASGPGRPGLDRERQVAGGDRRFAMNRFEQASGASSERGCIVSPSFRSREEGRVRVRRRPARSRRPACARSGGAASGARAAGLRRASTRRLR